MYKNENRSNYISISIWLCYVFIAPPIAALKHNGNDPYITTKARLPLHEDGWFLICIALDGLLLIRLLDFQMAESNPPGKYKNKGNGLRIRVLPMTLIETLYVLLRSNDNKFGFVKGLLLYRTKHIPKPMLTSHKLGVVVFTWEQFYSNLPFCIMSLKSIILKLLPGADEMTGSL